MRFAKKGMSLFLVITLLSMIVIPGNGVSAASFTKHWAQGSMDRWVSQGIVQGYPDGSFHPNDQVNRAELVTIINKLFRYETKSEQNFSDISIGSWYYDAFSIAKQAGYYEGYPGNLAKASSSLTRQDAVTIIAKALSLESDNQNRAKSFLDASSIDSYALTAVDALGDVVRGYPDGTFRPNQTITRAELMKVLDQLVPGFFSSAGTVTGGQINNHTIINQEDIILKDTVISGNLYLAAGIGDGDITLDNVTVQGTTFISGGGEHSIKLQKANLSRVIVNRPDGKVRVLVSGTTKIDQIVVNSNSILELESGTSIGSIQMNAPASILIANGATITSLVIGSGASGTTIDGEGSITSLTVLVDGVKINGQLIPANTTVSINKGKVQPVISSGNGSVVTGSNSSSGSGGGSDNSGGGSVNASIHLVDSQATAETKSLFSYLNEIRGKNVLFGHQHDTTVSFAGKDNQGKVISDVKNSVGDYPAVFGWDTLSLDGYENPPGVSGDYEASRKGLSAAMKEAYDLGGIVTLSTHPYNPVTGGDFKDTSNTEGATQSVVTRILPGGDKNSEFKQYLDRIASFANQLKDDNGKLIPVLFRPFHEQNGGWFWWGASTTTKSEYIELYRYTVEYLRDTKGVRNFLYVYSPNGPFNGNENEYLTTYPGDYYVDILGMDQYDNKDNAGSEGFLNGLVKDLKMISKLADRKGKIATLSEYGYSAAGMKTTGNNEKEWFTKILKAIQSDSDARKIAYMLTWANFGEGNNLYVPYHNAATLGDHELLPDFINFYKDPYTAFVSEVKAQNVYHRQVTVSKKQPFMHIVSPTNIGTVTDSNTIIRAKVLNVVPTKVTYTISGSTAIEIEMTLDSDGYYSAPWTPEAGLNGKSADITVRAYGTGSSNLEQNISVFVKVGELLIKQLTFDTPDTINQIQNNGTYPDTIHMGLGHSIIDGNGKLEIGVSDGLVASDTWQELKLELTAESLTGVNLSEVKRVKFNALIPESAQNDGQNAGIRAVVQLPPDWSETGKYGMNTTYKSLSELEQVEISGIPYYKYNVDIELDNPEKSAEATGLAISFVGSGLVSQDGLSIYADDISLYSTYTAPVVDVSLVDDFESYNGSNDAVAAKYPKAGGDDVSVSLSSDHKGTGDYGMQLQYALSTAGYTGVGKSLGSVNWSEYNALHLWVATDGVNSYAEQGKPQKLVIQMNMNGVAYEAYPVLEPSSSGELLIPFDDFVVASWSSGGPVNKVNLKKVQNFNLYVNSMDNSSHTGTLYFDDIRAVYDSSLPEVPDNGGGQGTGHAPGVLYEFKSEEDIVGWKLENNTAKAQAPIYADSEQALSTLFDLTNTGKNNEGKSNEEFELVVYPSSLDLTGLDSISAQVKLSKGTAKARLFIKTGSAWDWHDSGTLLEVNSNGYATMAISLGAIPADALKDIKAIGIKIEDISNDGGTAELYLKDITLAAVTPIVKYGFETDVEGWAATSGSAATQAVYTEGGVSSNVLKVDFSWLSTDTDPWIAAAKESNLDLSAFTKLSAKVKIESAVPNVQAKLFVQVTDAWTWHATDAAISDEEGFTLFEFDLSKISAEDLKVVKKIGIQFVTPNGTEGTATGYIDEVWASK
ncbi:glycosyl hydrolase [Paenibacillus segetis]|uniref:Mannan endo-1,4-beta-mannosidase n=1 Tax=Paenibacillus segetis TaxID=1325360 RepID=A0ABQ1YIX0_9BACL|nr:glycosyl hydrolase [Paenibacillus segetis]GGH27942.1 hypothetical protein GCM10008013_29660 [Paenibacillus segetis]